MTDRGPIELRVNPDNPREGAYRTGPGVTAGEWFVFTDDHGGSYTDGVREGCENWPVAVKKTTKAVKRST